MQLTHKAGLALVSMILWALAASSSAQAQITEYTNRAAFTAASTNLTTLDFAIANTSGGTFTNYRTAAGLTLSGVNFTATNGGTPVLSVTAPNFFVTYQGFNGNPTVLTDGSNAFPNSAPVLTVALPANITSVGTDLYTIHIGDGDPNTVSPVDFVFFSGATQIGSFTVSTFEKPTLAFAGFTSAQAITSIQITGENNTFANLSSFAFGKSATPVPEASTTTSFGLLLCLGLGGLVVSARRRKARAAE